MHLLRSCLMPSPSYLPLYCHPINTWWNVWNTLFTLCSCLKLHVFISHLYKDRIFKLPNITVSIMTCSNINKKLALQSNIITSYHNECHMRCCQIWNWIFSNIYLGVSKWRGLTKVASQIPLVPSMNWNSNISMLTIFLIPSANAKTLHYLIHYFMKTSALIWNL